MKILDNVIVDFYFPGNFDESLEKEASFLECFLSENSQLVFSEVKSNLYPKIEGIGLREEIREIVLKNTLLITKEKLFDLYYQTDEDEYFYWFSPKNTEDLVKILEHNHYFYICVVVEKGKNIKEYDYLLDKTEHFQCDHFPYKEYCGSWALLVREKVKKSFVNTIQPKIEKLFKHIVK